MPRRRPVGLVFGGMHSARRGTGTDVAGSRPYRPGDNVGSIDWNASAKLSAARGTDEFIVREHYADEAPRVVVVCDRRPEMALFPPELPWLRKRSAMREAVELILDSAVAARGLVGYLDFAEVDNPDLAQRSAEPFWRPPRSQGEPVAVKERHLEHPSFHAPQDNLTKAFAYLSEFRQSLPAGSFVFICSDFLVFPSEATWVRALEYRWDLVPVVIQDPVWEQSFPAVDGVVLPLADALTGRIQYVRLSRKQAAERRRAHEERFEELLAVFQALDLEPVVVSTSERDRIFSSFLGWAEQRLYDRRRRA